MTRYVSKPVEMEAMQWLPGEWMTAGDQTPETQAQHDAERIVAWVNANGGEAHVGQVAGHLRVIVRTNSGWAVVAPGWWVIKGSEQFAAWHDADDPDSHYVVLDHYPCDPTTFDKRWTLAP